MTTKKDAIIAEPAEVLERPVQLTNGRWLTAEEEWKLITAFVPSK